MLSVLVAPMEDTKATAALVKMLPMFQDFPDEAFSPASCEHIAGQCKWVPRYSDLREKLGAWWKDHRPPPRVDYALEHAKSAADDLARQATNRASWDDAAAIRSSVRNVLTLPANAPFRADLGKWLGKAVSFYAPHHLHHVPPEWHPIWEDVA